MFELYIYQVAGERNSSSGDDHLAIILHGSSYDREDCAGVDFKNGSILLDINSVINSHSEWNITPDS